MKSVSYPVYVHLNQVNGEVEYAKCSCKAGQGGCCKHVAALLYTILDFVNLNLKHVPVELTCTQLPQKWSVPSGSSKTLDKAVKFEEMLFEKADVNKPAKRYIVKGSREDYCATPPFARTVTAEEIKSMANAFEKANCASLFREAIASNNYKPCELFETSCNQLQNRKLDNSSVPIPTQIPPSQLVDQIFKNVPNGYTPPSDYSPEQLELVKTKVGLTVSTAKDICLSTMRQNKDPQWYAERSKRLTASIFGKVINRRKKNHPASLIESILCVDHEKRKCLHLYSGAWIMKVMQLLNIKM
ncbi:uncharacterized protein LOC114544312 [Dendronephthya gigantea]|uniref:uncharacterized protein LOC114544312 n=1 Tax=Dendronephthya gigantea TaxID=151771 RepID=UPI001069DE5F|nr:uncharacterized protein LOC114544312 [Dendronephthya gigantea]